MGAREKPQRRGVRQAGLAAGERHRRLQPAELVYQPVAGRVRPGPHPSPRDVVHLVDGQPARVGDLAGEVRVDPVEPGVQPRPLLVAERARRGEHVGVAALGHRVDAHPGALQQAGGDRLAAEHPDGAGERPRLGHDRVGRHGDVIPAGGGHVRHRHHHRRARRAGPHHLAPDRVGRHVRAAGAVDPQDDRPGPAVVGGGPQRGGDRVGSHRPAADRAAPAAAAPDWAGRVDEGDHVLGRVGQLARPLGQGAGTLVAAEIEQEGTGPGVLADVGVDLVPVTEGIHQPVVQRLAGQERPAIDQRPGLAVADLEPLRDRVGELLRDRDREPLHRLPGRPGESALGEPVGGALVFLPLRDLVVQAELVQRVAEEQLLDADPGQLEFPGRLKVDPVERGRQVVRHVPGRGFAERLRPGHGGLAGPGELLHGGPQLLDPGQPDRPPAELDHQRLHPVIGSGPAQPLQHVRQAGPPHREQGGDGIGGRLLGESLGEVEFQDQRGGPPLTHPDNFLLQHRLGHAFHLTGHRSRRRGAGSPAAAGEHGWDGRYLSYRRLR